ncbi:nucleotidyl transferase AbiEii/AbiGii toxin family protein [Corallococcus macrosporus]|uniref:Nucleotidyltransferase family protein n=1 Tax=Myxococcus fulvus (strain ATCC BAA-855 / HW-1) TaxID=483219 RepID=F8CR18_MYXFH|nr:nucleotidyl transferase AbiEii/AbiGii toxin family protein [Corallococcus macrosporus]AEI63062.1 hypothetical protein LILAB_05705 [Corallococcus macrosporus]
MDARYERTIEVAEQVVELLKRHDVPAILIGAAAMAAHHYVRQTEDLDLAINVDPYKSFRQLEATLRDHGFEVTFEYPDDGDALGGVLRISGADFDPIEVVNFQNPWPGARDATVLVREAMQAAHMSLGPGSPLRVVSLPYLIALKLYAQGRKSINDVVELLEHNRPSLNVAELRDVCGRHGLRPSLEPLLEELGIK